MRFAFFSLAFTFVWSSIFGLAGAAAFFYFGAAFKNPAENPPKPEFDFFAAGLATAFFGASFSNVALSSFGWITLTPAFAASGYFFGANLTSSTWSSVLFPPNP